MENKFLTFFSGNPMYEKLTVSRQSYIRDSNSMELTRKPSRLHRSKNKLFILPLKSFNTEQNIITVNKTRILQNFFFVE